MSNKDIQNYFNSKASTWDQTVNHNPEKINLILQVTDLKEDSKILDIGSGTGVLVEYLEKYSPEKIVELDLSSEMLKQAKRKYNYSNIEYLNESFYEANLNGFNYLICYSSYPHFENKEKFCQKAFDSLAEDGRFVIAHSQSKSKINKVHQDGKVSKISSKLGNAFVEAKIFKEDFNVDIIVDTEELFVISGVKKLKKSKKSDMDEQ